MLGHLHPFQSPSGDSLFSDSGTDCSDAGEQPTRFNPLAGIRCFLTSSSIFANRSTVFQSPSGDSLFSDPHPLDEALYLRESGFTHRFNPLAGIRCFLTWHIYFGRMAHGRGFQSPSGDSLFSDEVF